MPTAGLIDTLRQPRTVRFIFCMALVAGISGAVFLLTAHLANQAELARLKHLNRLALAPCTVQLEPNHPYTIEYLPEAEVEGVLVRGPEDVPAFTIRGQDVDFTRWEDFIIQERVGTVTSTSGHIHIELAQPLTGSQQAVFRFVAHRDHPVQGLPLFALGIIGLLAGVIFLVIGFIASR